MPKWVMSKGSVWI